MPSVNHSSGQIDTMASPHELNWGFRSLVHCIFSKSPNNRENVNVVFGVQTSTTSPTSLIMRSDLLMDFFRLITVASSLLIAQQ